MHPIPLDLSPFSFPSSGNPAASSKGTASPSAARTAAERVLAAELQSRGEPCDALSMMVSSLARMVQAGKSCDSRWKAS